MEPVEKDRINHPDHYTAGGIEVYDFIEAWNLDFACGNVIKYVARAPYKGSHLEDLKKARWYLERAIEREQSRIAARVSRALNEQPDQQAFEAKYKWNTLSLAELAQR